MWPFKSKHFLPTSNNKVRVKVGVIFRAAAAVHSYLTSSICGTYCDVYCLYSVTRVMLKLRERARGHFMTLIEILGEWAIFARRPYWP